MRKYTSASWKMFSGVFFYSKLAPRIGDVIRHKQDWPEIVEVGFYSDESLTEVKSNADRAGYVLYQSLKERLEID